MSKYPEPVRFNPINKQKYIGNVGNIWARSSWELKFLRWCDRNPSVLKYNSEDVIIKYFSSADNKIRNYHIDFYIIVKKLDGTISKMLIEIKPYVQTIQPKKNNKKNKTFLYECYTYQVNMDKWQAAEKFAFKNSMEFKVLTEYDLGLKKWGNK